MKHVMMTVWISLTYWLGYHGTARNVCLSRYPPRYHGYCIEPSLCTGATLRGGCEEEPVAVCCVTDDGLNAIPEPTSPIVSRQAFYSLVGETQRTRKLFPLLLKVLEDTGLSKELNKIPAFLAQIFQETSSLNEMEENSDGAEYEGSVELGNIQSGDGRMFISRGLLPIVGRYMYQAVGNVINENLIGQPELAAMPSTAAKITVWLWRNGYSSVRNLGNKQATQSLDSYCSTECQKYDFARMTYAIKNETTGLQGRLQYWSQALSVLGVSCPANGGGPTCTVGTKKGFCVLKDVCKGQYKDGVCSGSTAITCCLDCQTPLDIVFIVDSSGSVGRQEFKRTLDFVANITQSFDISLVPGGTRVALIRYAETAEVIFKFNTFANRVDLLSAIRNTPFSQNPSATYTDDALLLSQDALFGDSLSGVRERYQGIPRVLVLLTDGKTKRGFQSIVQPSRKLKESGVNILVIAVGKKLSFLEINEIASDPDDQHVYNLNTFSEFRLQGFQKRLQDDFCYEPALLYQNLTVVSSVLQHDIKYYKYRVTNVTGPFTVYLKQSEGQTELQASLVSKNPRKTSFNWDICNNNTRRVKRASPPCFSDPNTFVSQQKDGGREKFLTVHTCDRDFLYVSVEGMNHRNNRFNLTLINGTVVLNNTNSSSGLNISSNTYKVKKKIKNKSVFMKVF